VIYAQTGTVLGGLVLGMIVFAFMPSELPDVSPREARRKPGRRQTQADTLKGYMLDSPPASVSIAATSIARSQENLALEIAEIIARAPLYTCAMPRTGALMSVRMTNCGELGWLSDKDGGYRYAPRHRSRTRLGRPSPRRFFSPGSVWPVTRRRRKPA